MTHHHRCQQHRNECFSFVTFFPKISLRAAIKHISHLYDAQCYLFLAEPICVSCLYAGAASIPLSMPFGTTFNIFISIHFSMFDLRTCVFIYALDRKMPSIHTHEYIYICIFPKNSTHT